MIKEFQTLSLVCINKLDLSKKDPFAYLFYLLLTEHIHQPAIFNKIQILCYLHLSYDRPYTNVKDGVLIPRSLRHRTNLYYVNKYNINSLVSQVVNWVSFKFSSIFIVLGDYINFVDITMVWKVVCTSKVILMCEFVCDHNIIHKFGVHVITAMNQTFVFQQTSFDGC